MIILRQTHQVQVEVSSVKAGLPHIWSHSGGRELLSDPFCNMFFNVKMVNLPAKPLEPTNPRAISVVSASRFHWMPLGRLFGRTSAVGSQQSSFACALAAAWNDIRELQLTSCQRMRFKSHERCPFLTGWFMGSPLVRYMEPPMGT